MDLLNLVEKRLNFTSNRTTAWHHGVRDASLNTHLQSFDRLIPVEYGKHLYDTLLIICRHPPPPTHTFA